MFYSPALKKWGLYWICLVLPSFCDSVFQSFGNLFFTLYALVICNHNCNMMQLTRKRIKKIHASYTLEGTNLENVESIKYLGVTTTSDLRWNTHVSNVCTKANRTLGFLRRNLYSSPLEVKEAAYKGLVRPVLDYGSSVWDPQV